MATKQSDHLWPTLDEFHTFPKRWLDWEPYLPTATMHAIKWAWIACSSGGQDWAKTYETLSTYFQ